MVEINAPVLRERVHLSNIPANRRPTVLLSALILGRIPAMKGSTERVFPDSHSRPTECCERSGHYGAIANSCNPVHRLLREALVRMIGGLVALLVGALGGLFLYRAYLTQPPAVAGESAPAATPAQTVNIIGVKSDLLSIAEAERAYQAEHSSIASLDELE